MTKQHKLVKRVQHLEDRHRRDMVRLKKELISAVNHIIEERLDVVVLRERDLMEEQDR